MFKNPSAKVLFLALTLLALGFSRAAGHAKPVEAAPPTLSVSGTGGVVPNQYDAGASFDITINDPRFIASSGNNVTLTLVALNAQGTTDYRATLEHVGYGVPKVAFENVLNLSDYVCKSNLVGDYLFQSGAANTLRTACGSNDVGGQPGSLPPGTYLPTLADDVTDSGLSSAWNGQRVAGTWRLNLTDGLDVSGLSYEEQMNSNWTWRLDFTGLQDIPPQCDGMTFNQTIHMTNPIYNSFSNNRQLVFAPSTGNVSISMPLAHDSCIVAGIGSMTASVGSGKNVLVGGPGRDVLTGGSGNDTLIGGGAPTGQKDTLNGSGGTDTCVGTAAQTVKLSCEN